MIVGLSDPSLSNRSSASGQLIKSVADLNSLTMTELMKIGIIRADALVGLFFGKRREFEIETHRN